MSEDYRQIYKDNYGIEFTSDYEVHHIDMNRNNNDISNLLLLPKKLHHQYHFALSQLNEMADEEGYKESICMFSGMIDETTKWSYMLGTLTRFGVAMEECAKWYDYKLSLEGLWVPDHNLNTFGITRRSYK